MFEQLQRLRINYSKYFEEDSTEYITKLVDRIGKFILENPEADLRDFKEHMTMRLKLSNELLERKINEQ